MRQLQKRPLAFLGGVFLLCSLAAIKLPPVVLLPLVGLLAALFLLSVWKYRKNKQKMILVPIGAACLAVLLYVVYMHTAVKPLQVLAGQERQAYMRVVDTTPTDGGAINTVTLQVLSLNGEKPPATLKVKLYGFASVEIGQEMEAKLVFYTLTSRSASYQASQGVYIGARLASAPSYTKVSNDFISVMRRLQYEAGDNIRLRLSGDLGATAAAMSVGDERHLSESTKEAYRMAGLSHVLVVSGQHLSVLCGACYVALRRMLRREKWAAAVCLGLIGIFVTFTGFGASIVRSGIAMGLVYAAQLLGRKADVYTSLGAAALLMCAVNPFAAADIGLLLSLTATLGVVQGGKLADRQKSKLADRQKRSRGNLINWLQRQIIPPICVTVATLPVLLLSGLGVSLLGLPMNMIALPLLSPLVLLGFLMALPHISVLGAVGQAAAIIEGVILHILRWLTEWCQSMSGLYLFVGGVLVVGILLLYPLGAAAVKTQRRGAFLLAGIVLLSTASILDIGVGNGVVNVTVAGGAVNPSVVVVQGRQAVVLYRGQRSNSAVRQVLQQANIQSIPLVVDMTAGEMRQNIFVDYQVDDYIKPANDIINHKELAPLAKVQVLIKKQGGGTVACVDIDGYKIGVTTGKMNLSHYAKLDVLVAGSGSTVGSYDMLVTTGTVPEWAAEDTPIYMSDGWPRITVRPGKSVVVKEGIYADANEQAGSSAAE